MPKYRVWETKEIIEIQNLQEFNFPFSGAKVIFKIAPNIVLEVSTD